MINKEKQIGKIYGQLTILNFEPNKVYTDKNNKRYNYLIVKCQCDCGNFWTGLFNDIKNGHTLSCGCLKKKSPNAITHNLSYSSEYRSWSSMKDRCLNPNNPKFKYWGGRGILICDNWINSFENFLKDMGHKPSSKHSIDRINNNGNYCPENCKWSTQTEQNNNKRKI